MRRFKLKIQIIVASALFIIPCFILPIEAKTFKIVSYNVENLFDLTKDGTEYIEYVPNSGHGWNKDIVDIKVSNIAKVIKDLSADVVALQEIESKKALILLQNKLRKFNVDYPYIEIADSKATTVKCAILSKFPIVNKKDIEINNRFERNILKITLDIEDRPLILFVNHWKSKQSPESQRIVYAKKLREEIDKLKEGVDFILTGDFNSNYNEYETFRDSKSLNDTAGITGINHILGTIKGSGIVNEKILMEQPGNEYLYNLWLEVNKSRRWSHNFFGDKNSLDNIIVSKGLYDNQGISYVDGSFDKFDSGYLFKRNAVYRWQISEKGRGKHLGQGYSDHLPVFAYFSTEPFQFKNKNIVSSDNTSSKLKETKISRSLIDLNTAAEKELQAVKGIGPVISARIIAGRLYKTVDDLIKVKGIGPKTLEKIRPYLTVAEKRTKPNNDL
ncbi:MAG: helix-hairpin-helix domain-containing protein [Candidatus Omnitrophota bacterium]